ncbi:MAG TPA: PAS domain S-box protein [Fimbriimonas sp.]|nr:PAS domain S-box protein [Fimbriimonas sp.]
MLEKTRSRFSLSERERQLVQFASEGLTDTAIAHKLGISEATVSTYWGRVRIKLGPFSRTELVAMVIQTEQRASLDALREKNGALVAQLNGSGANKLVASNHEILENAPDAIFLVGADGKIAFANRKAHTLFGYAGGELTNRELDMLIPVRYRDVHRHHRADYLELRGRHVMGEHMETPALHKSGEEFPIQATLSTLENSAESLIICFVRAAEQPALERGESSQASSQASCATDAPAKREQPRENRTARTAGQRDAAFR